MKQKILTFLRKLFKVHNPSEEWPNAVRSFKAGDWVYCSDWCYGVIVDFISDEDELYAIVEFDTPGGGGRTTFPLDELTHAEPPKQEKRDQFQALLGQTPVGETEIFSHKKKEKTPMFTREERNLIMAYICVVIFIAGLLAGLIFLASSNKAKAVEPELMVDTTVTQPEVIEPEIEEVETVKYFDVPLEHNLQDHIFDICESRSIDPAIIIAMIQRESSFNPDCIGDGGDSLGLMQIQPKWHQARADKLGCTNLMNPYSNVLVGIDLFSDLMGQRGSLEWALMAYNGGPSYANRKANNGEISDYAVSVINISKNLERCIEP